MFHNITINYKRFEDNINKLTKRKQTVLFNKIIKRVYDFIHNDYIIKKLVDGYVNEWDINWELLKQKQQDKTRIEFFLLDVSMNYGLFNIEPEFENDKPRYYNPMEIFKIIKNYKVEMFDSLIRLMIYHITHNNDKQSLEFYELNQINKQYKISKEDINLYEINQCFWT